MTQDVATSTDDLISCPKKDVGTQTDFSDLNILTPAKHQFSESYDLSIETPSLKTDSDADSDETRHDSPVNEFDPDATIDYSYKASDEEVDSDATRLDTPQTVSEKYEAIRSEQSDSSGSSYIETYIGDPSYDGPAYHSQPCSKHGASYTPPGWKKVMIKRRKLEFPKTSDKI